MSAEAAQAGGVAKGRLPDRDTPVFDESTAQQMSIVREAFRLRRLAHEQRRLYCLYDEHSLFNAASIARRTMMHTLRAASSLWRRVLGLTP